MFESRKNKLIPRQQFYGRLARSFAIGSGVIVIAICIGMLGYHFFEGLGWIDAFMNTAMLISGEGPITPPITSGGKIFAGCYALFSGLLFISTVGFVFAPVVHRFLHKFHIGEAEADDKKDELTEPRENNRRGDR